MKHIKQTQQINITRKHNKLGKHETETKKQHTGTTNI